MIHINLCWRTDVHPPVYILCYALHILLGRISWSHYNVLHNKLLFMEKYK